MQPFNQKESNISCATRSQPCCRDNERRVKKKEEKIKTRENIHTGHTSSMLGMQWAPLASFGSGQNHSRVGHMHILDMKIRLGLSFLCLCIFGMHRTRETSENYFRHTPTWNDFDKRGSRDLLLEE